MVTRVVPALSDQNIGRARRHGVTLRAILIAFLLTPLNVLFLVHATWTVGSFTGGESLFANAVAFLFLSALANNLLKRWRPSWTFRPGELLTMYVLVATSTGLTCGVWDFGGSLVGGISYPFWFATPANGWETLLWPYLPEWLTVRDTAVLEGFYAGRSTPYTLAVLKAWGGPALWWTGLLTVIMWVCLCLNSLVRRRWEEEEKLAFPLTILPVHIVTEPLGLLRARLFWTGVAVATGLGVWSTLQGFMPSLPAAPVGMDYRPYLQHPWWSIRYPLMEWGPWQLGLCYLIPPDLTLSLLVFDLLWMAQYVASTQMGWCTSSWSGFPYGDEQATGSLLALLCVTLWLDRRYLVQVMRRALGLPAAVSDDSREALGYRTAVLGTAIGAAVILWFLSRAGMAGWVAVLFLALYFSISLVLSRLRAQLGAPAHALYRSMPNHILTALVGTSTLGGSSLGMFALMGTYLREQRSNPSPIQIEAMKMAEGETMERRRIALALIAIVPVAILCYFWASLHFGYHLGMGTGNTHRWLMFNAESYYDEMDTALRSPAGPDVSAITAMGVGMAFTALMMLAKLRFAWWPLHPVAYPLAISSTVQDLTAALFVTWLTKTLLLRYGGLRAYRASLPLFLGMLAGGAATALLQRLLYDSLGLRIGVLG